MSRFQPGQSGNPGGRPREDRELREACRAKTEKAIKTLERVMDNKKAPPAAKVAAACAILDRGYGRPAQSIAMNLTDSRFVVSEYTDTELESIVSGGKPPALEHKEKKWEHKYCVEKPDSDEAKH